MNCRLLLPALVLLVGCGGDTGPSSDRFLGLWQLETVNGQAVPAAGTVGTALWAAAVLQVGGQVNQQAGTFDSCMQDPSTSSQTDASTAIVTKPLGDKLAVQYFERRDTSSDTLSMSGAKLVLHYRYTQLFGPVLGTEVLTFVPLAGDLPPACSLAPPP